LFLLISEKKSIETGIAQIIQMIGSRIHMPLYPIIGTIKAAATNFDTNSIILADNGTIFLPNP
jgi:hypothetical protein